MAAPGAIPAYRCPEPSQHLLELLLQEPKLRPLPLHGRQLRTHESEQPWAHGTPGPAVQSGGQRSKLSKGEP